MKTKKGAIADMLTSPVGWMIFLAIVVLIFGPAMFSYGKNVLEQWGVIHTENETGTRVIGETALIPAIELTGTREEVKTQIINSLYGCWNQMKRKEIDTHKCAPITFSGYTFSRAELVNGLNAKDEEAGEAFNDNWSEYLEDKFGNTLPEGKYLVCADYDWPDDDDLLLSTDMNDDCE